jgi:hypothetical protein
MDGISVPRRRFGKFPILYTRSSRRSTALMSREHQVYFADDASESQLRNRMEAAATNLLEFFHYNAQHADGCQYRYPEFHQNGKAIGRMYQSSPPPR